MLLKLTKLFSVLGLILAVGACASATTKVSQPVAAPVKAETIQIVRAADTVAVEQSVSEHFEKRLRQYLYEKGPFKEGDDVTVTYRFVQLDRGSRASRYFLGPFGGKGTMTIEAVFTDGNSNTLSTIEVGGEIAGGIFGGDFDEALSKAAGEVSDYAEEFFGAGETANVSR
ncbi:MAG: DUF4410 domain-containing protein [Pseudomonadota bacterium]